jgi:stress response protein YsnF
LAIVVGSAVVAVGGGGIKSMQRYWERATTTAEQRAPELKQQAQQSAQASAFDDGDGAAVTLHEETPVVEKRVVPRERVRMDTETVTEERQISPEVRQEQIEVDGDQERFGRQDQS